ncbi:MAG: tetratricopeptide repeat protein [Candidatus Wallbacteria bacterium]|nr:tetratricopeptide repeat protein [Candidatus Wallbacteria bacterium]
MRFAQIPSRVVLMALALAGACVLAASDLPVVWKVERDLALSLEAAGEQERAHAIFAKLDEGGLGGDEILAGRVRTALATSRTREAAGLADRLERSSGLSRRERVVLLAYIWLEQEDARGRLGALVGELEALGADAEARAQLVRCYLALGQGPKAAALLDQMLAAGPRTDELVLLRGQLHLEAGKPLLALETLKLRTAKGAAPQAEQDWSWLEARAARAAGQHERARRAAGRLMQLSPRDVEAIVFAAEADLASGRTTEALALLDRAAGIDPNREQTRRLSMDALFRKGDHARLALESRELLALKPGDRDVRRGLAWTLIDLGRHDEALETALPLKQHSNTPLEDLKLIAEAFRGAGLKDRALETWQEIAARETGPAAARAVAELSSDLGRFSEAVAAAQQWRRRAPEDWAPTLLLYQAYSALRRDGEALGALEQTLAKGLPQAHRRQLEQDRFYLLIKLGRSVDALAAGAVLLAAYPDATEARRSQAFLLSGSGRAAEAAAVFAPVLFRAGARPTVQDRLDYANLLWAAGSRDQAVALLVEARRVERPGGPLHRRLLDFLAARPKDHRRAAGLARLLEGPAARDREAFGAVVRAWIAMGRPREARELLVPRWNAPGPREEWLERLTAQYFLAVSRWKEAEAILSRLVGRPGEELDRHFAAAQSRLLAPPHLQRQARERLASIRASGIASAPDSIRELDRLEGLALGWATESRLRHREASDGLRETAPSVRAAWAAGGEWTAELELSRPWIRRPGLVRSGESPALVMSRQTGRDLALSVRVASAAGIEGGDALAAGVGAVIAAGDHGDPLRISAGRELIEESPHAWARGLSAATVRLELERPRDGGSVSTSLAAFAQDLEDGIRRWSVLGAARVRPHPRLELGLITDVRDASSQPDPPVLYFAPQDYYSADLEAVWQAARLGGAGSWSLRAGRHMDWLSGSPAKGWYGALIGEVPMGQNRALQCEFSRLTNSANRFQGTVATYTESGLNLAYIARF